MTGTSCNSLKGAHCLITALSEYLSTGLNHPRIRREIIRLTLVDIGEKNVIRIFSKINEQI